MAQLSGTAGGVAARPQRPRATDEAVGGRRHRVRIDLGRGVSRRGGDRVPAAVVEQVANWLEVVVGRLYTDVCRELIVRMRGRSLYLDSHRVGEEEEPPHLCRLDWLGHPNEWGLAFYRYTRMRYERNVTVTGEWTGTVEECSAAAAIACLDGYRQVNPSGINGRLDYRCRSPLCGSPRRARMGPRAPGRLSPDVMGARHEFVPCPDLRVHGFNSSVNLLEIRRGEWQ